MTAATSTWGASWGTSWLTSWNRDAAEPDVVTSHGGSWNKDWAKVYGPEKREHDIERAKKAKAKEVAKAIRVIKAAEHVPPSVQEAKHIVHAMPVKRSLTADLMADKQVKVEVMTAYYEYVRWLQKDEADIAAILRLL